MRLVVLSSPTPWHNPQLALATFRQRRIMTNRRAREVALWSGYWQAMPQIGRSIFVALLVLCASCDDGSKPTRSNVSTQPAQKVTSLTNADEQRLREQRAVVEKHLADASREKYQTAAGKLGLIRAVLQANVYKANQTYELQCLGIVLGDAFVQELKMEWVMVEDQYGRDPAVRLPGTTIIMFPLTMISKRIEHGEKVDVFALFNGVAAQVDDIKRRRG